MTLQDYARGLGERGLLIVKDRAFGQMNGYPYFIYPNWRGSVIHSLAAVFHFSQNVRPRYLKNQVPDTKLTSGTNPGTLTMTVKVDKLDDGKDSLNRFFQKMGEFTDAAHKMGLTAPGKCPICKQGNCDSLALFPQGYVPTHRACVEQSNFDRIRDAADNSEHGNHGLGILGAFLGAMLGCLLVFLIAMFSGNIYAVLYVVIPLASYYGYKLFKGRMDKTALTSVLIFSILSLFAFEFANFAVVWHRQIGEWLSPAGLFSRYFQIMSGSVLIVCSRYVSVSQASFSALRRSWSLRNRNSASSPSVALGQTSSTQARSSAGIEPGLSQQTMIFPSGPMSWRSICIWSGALSSRKTIWFLPAGRRMERENRWKTCSKRGNASIFFQTRTTLSSMPRIQKCSWT